MASKFGGVAVDDSKGGSKFGGVPVDQPPMDKPWIGQPRPEDESLLPYLFHLPAYGLQDIGTGIKHLATSGQRQAGVHELIKGTGELAFPALPLGAVASLPIAGGAGLLPYLGTLGGATVGGTAGGALGYGGASLAGASPETAQLAGDIGALAGGTVGAKAAPLIGNVGKAAAKGAAEGAIRHYEKQGGIVSGAIKRGLEALREPTPPPDLPVGLARSNEAFPEGGSGGVAKQARKFTPGQETYGPARPAARKAGGGGASMGTAKPTPPPPPPTSTAAPATEPATTAEQDMINHTAEKAAQGYKDMVARTDKIRDYFINKGMSKADVMKMSDVEFRNHLQAGGFRPPGENPTGWHRTLGQIRWHVAEGMK